MPKTNNDLEVFIGELKKDRRRVTGIKDTTAFILREGRVVALLQSLPTERNWLEAIATVDIEHFKKSLTELRRTEQRQQAWLARHDLAQYLTQLEEQEWTAPN